MLLSMIVAHADAAAVAAGLLFMSGLYLAGVLPRVPPRVGWFATAALVLALLLGAALLASLPLSLALLAACVALAFGQIGWSLRTPASSAATANKPAAAQRAPAKAVATKPPAGAASILPAPAHKQLGRYLIDRQIGRGAMGAVYLGHDPKIGRQVAIKTMALSKEFDGPELAEARTRFFREAETAGRLQHRDIVTIFDAGEDQDLAYIAMEFLKGQDLQRHTQAAHLLPVPVVLRTVARVADALAYAHSQGVVHRDIKPANVMVDLAADTVKVTDFGIARITDASRTRTGMVLGTPSFMSPEQMAGRRVDGRSDLYSLGAMLFQLLTGRLPHHAESMAKLMYLIANEPASDVRSLRPELPEALAKVVALALEKRPEARCADGRLLARELRAVAAAMGPAIAPPPPGPPGAPPGPASPEADGFAATVKFSRADPGHNSGP